MSESAKKNAKAATPTAWEVVQLARDPGRPTARQYAEGMCDEFLELHDVPRGGGGGLGCLLGGVGHGCSPYFWR